MTVSPVSFFLLIRLCVCIIVVFITLYYTVATARLQQGAYMVREEDEVQTICVILEGLREINLTLTLSTLSLPQSAQGICEV